MLLEMSRLGPSGELFIYAGLLFGNQNLHFFCQRSHATMEVEIFDEPYSGQLSMVRGQGKDELYRLWENLLLKYSTYNSHSFTMATDILRALSGLAMHIGKILEDHYLAVSYQASKIR